MKSLSDIQHLYTPVQPTVYASDQHVSYTEWLPDERLQNSIYCYWQLQTTSELPDPFNYHVVADGCIDIYFDLNDPKESYVMGFCDSFTEFSLGKQFNYVGIRFFPTMFPQLFRVNARTLSNRFVDLHTILPEVAVFLSDHFHKQLTPVEMSALFNSYFIECVTTTTFDEDNRLYRAIALILNHSGNIAIEKELATGISSRQLRRLFDYYIGTTPKTFSKVIRFQRTIVNGSSGHPVMESNEFFDAGYYDQAHFIKEFRTFYGTTPGKVPER